MSETEKKTEEKKKISSKLKTPAQEGVAGATGEGARKISSSGPEQAAAAKPRGSAGAQADTAHAPSKKLSAAAKAAAPAAAKAAAPKASGSLRIRQIKSGICAPVDQKQTLLGLGLLRIRHEVVRPDTPTVRGQVHKVRHLVEIVEGGAAR
jgi:large subunit ribosomal protein L30